MPAVGSRMNLVVPPHQAETLIVGGIPTVRLTRAELAERMVQDCLRARSGEVALPRLVFSSNGATIAYYHGDTAIRQLFDQADLIDADGMPLVFATRLFCAEPLQQRVATTDFIHDAAEAAIRDGLRFYFLGSRPDVARHAAETLGRLHPGLKIVGTRDGFFKREDEAQICREIVEAGTDVVWLGLGTPLQERFAVANRERLAGVGWIKTCGGLFDHYNGTVARAPQWVQDSGFEWLFRAMQEPRRLGWRYLSTSPRALYHLLTNTRG